VIDGDTFEARVHVWPAFDLTTRVRLRSIDAPELKAHCEQEQTRAAAARDALRQILNERDVTISSVGPDKYYGRIVAEVSTRNTPDVSAAMLSKGVARSYSGGRRASWCEG
jgi:endonuclease YncB( thermonuclease family)